RLELGPGVPRMTQPEFLRLKVGLALRELGGQPVLAVLVRHAVRHGQRPQAGQPRRPQPGLLGELRPGQLFRRTVLALREAALRERPAPAAERVTVLL